LTDGDNRLADGVRQLDLFFPFGSEGQDGLQVLWEDGERVFCRGWRREADGSRRAVLAVLPAAEQPPPDILERLAHEYGLKDELDGAWAVRPLELVRERGRTILVLEDPGGELLEGLFGQPMAVGPFLHLALGLVAAIARLHQLGLIHKDLKPANILVDPGSGAVRLTGFGIASRLPRERQAPGPPEVIAGTLAYMAPEQTGRMNRSIDARSDLYALGVTFYQMLTGSLPFTAADPLEWVHCHVARQPLPPAMRLTGIPEPVSAIIMKLLAKTAEERYQTAAGLKADLRRCLAEWDVQGCIADFPLGTQDVPDRLLIPEKLYGREREIETLLAAFDRVVAEGTPELVLVSGYSGIGKSSVVNELHKVLVPPRGLFAAGKFDQYKRDIPYATLAQAFQGLIRPLLGKSDAELGPWREALREALGPNGQLMLDLVPELELLIGPQPPVPELPPQDAQRRFQLVFRRLLGVFARPEHPLALFLDDLQWLDAATLDLLEHLATQPELRHLLLVGAYRDNEVTPAHPLMRRLAAIRSAGGRVQDIVLAPLGLADVGRLIADALHCTKERAAPLTWLVHEKTVGNPFFTIQFLTALAEEGLLAVDHAAAHWCWDLERIHAKGYTDNVVDLLLGKLRRLPTATQHALQLLACLGNSAASATLNLVRGESEAALDAVLWEAVRAGLVFRQEGTYRFLHDRVQEAAYALLPEGERATEHLRIGWLLVAHTPPEAIEETVFEILSQLNRGATLITSAEERQQVAELNLIAGQRAKASTAYATALTYLVAGTAMLGEDGWARRYDLAFPLALARAECEFLTGALADAEARLADLARRAASLPDLATITRLQAELFTTRGWSDRAAEVCLDYLRQVGVAWSAHPTKEEVREEYERIWRQIGSRPIEALIDLPLMADPVACGTMDVLTAVLSVAFLIDPNLLGLVLCRMANLSLEHGHSDGSCQGYVWLGMILGPHFGDYRAAFHFGQLALDLVEQRGLRRFEARVYMGFGNRIIPWTRPVRTGRSLARRAFDAANKLGDLTYASYSCNNLIMNLLACGDPLAEVQREAEAGLDYVHRARFGLVVDTITVQLQLIRTLRGLTPSFGCFDEAGFDEERFERHLEEDPRLAIATCFYWIRKLQARFFGGVYGSAITAAAKAERLLWTVSSHFEFAEYHFYAALTRAALSDAASGAERSRHLEVLAAHHRQIQDWADNCPENFENRAALVGAEIARIEGRDRAAMDLYEQAIRSARANGFVHNEALAYELAARFYAGRGFEEFARVYLRHARDRYLRWGADGKARQLEHLYSHLRGDEHAPAPTSTIGALVEHLDFATVVKVSQAVSGEIVLEKLLDTLMRTAVEHAGARRGLLIVPRKTEQWIVAEAMTHADTVVVRQHDDRVTAIALPESIIHYVLRTREPVIVDDAAAEIRLAADTYIRRHQARSILCLPLLNQSQLVAVLYLENNLVPHVFTPARITVLKLLASQAAISLENARLHTDLINENRVRRQAEENLRRSEAFLIQAQQISQTGSWYWNVKTGAVRWSAEHFRIFGYDPATTQPSYAAFVEPIHSEDRPLVEQTLAAAVAAKSHLQMEYRVVLGDEAIKHLLSLGRSGVSESGDLEYVGTVMDITQRKRAEAEARESERRYREMQMELAHGNRLATMGQLTASIAHEIRQPIAATITNAQAALRWLARDPLDRQEVRQALARIIRDGSRAGDVISRIRGLIKKAPPQQDLLEINGAVREMIELTHAEAVKNDVSVRTDLADGLPLLHGDRVQLQQVLVNLIINAVEAAGTVAEGAREVLITTGKAEPNGVLVAIKDSGPGLPAATRAHLFEPFYTTKPGGLGMGLSICRSIIEAHGGRLWAEANEPRGAMFQFTVPAHPGSAL
jgi:predicted ATPase/signal transduction histidine kinase/GAF domain-containing protein